MNGVTFYLGRETTALECDFPIVEISQVAEQESWRKEINRPIYHIHKWWATRLGSVFRGITLAALSPPGTDTWKSFYDHHQLTGKVVLDPSMGSGTTLGEAVKLGAKATRHDGTSPEWREDLSSSPRRGLDFVRRGRGEATARGIATSDLGC